MVDFHDRLVDLFMVLNRWRRMSKRRPVMFIDEVDTASDNQIFLDFLAKLRAAYLKSQRNSKAVTFLSVILTGVTDVKHLKSKRTLTEAWTQAGIDEAVKLVLAEKSTLFETLTSKLANYPEIKDILYRILMYGESIGFNIDQEDQNQMSMYGFIMDKDYTIAVSNRIFETRLYNLFLSDDEMKNNAFSKKGTLEKNIFVEDGGLNMQLIMEHFIRTFTEVFGPLTDQFKEEDGRKYFLLYFLL